MKRDRFPPLRRGPNGEKLCRGCGNPVPKGRQTWCSNKCYHTYEPSCVRSAVRHRDKGICSICGRDTVYIKAAFLRMVGRQYDWHHSWGCPHHYVYGGKTKRIRGVALKAGWPADAARDWWEADHIIPFSEGGETVLENMRTLCYPCHKHRTKKWHGERRIARCSPHHQAMFDRPLTLSEHKSV